MADNKLKYKVELAGVDELSKALSVAEKHYFALDNSLAKTSKGLNENSSETMGLAKKTVEASSTIDKANKAKEASYSKTWQKMNSGFEKEKSALSSVGVSWSSLSTLVGGLTIVGTVGKAAKAYLELDRAARYLNTTLYGNTKVMGAATSMMADYRGYLDLTREEIRDIIHTGTELGMFTANTKQSAKAMHEWTLSVVHLSKATDTSTAAVGDMFFTMEKLYKLPHNKLNNIASAFTYIQQKTAISGEELARYNKTLEELFARIPEMSGNTRVQMTGDMMAIAGIMKKNFGNPEEISSLFGKMMHMGSKEGEAALAELSVASGRTMDDLRDSLRKGDVIGSFKILSQTLAAIPMDELQYQSERFQETLGLDYKTLIAVRKQAEDGGKYFDSLVAGERKAMAAGDLHQKAAMARQNQLLQLWEKLKNKFEDMFIALGGHIVRFATKISQVVMPMLMKGFDWVTHKIEWLGSKEGVAMIDGWAKSVSDAFIWVIDKVLVPTKDAIVWLVEAIGKLTPTQKSVIGWAAGIGLALRALGPELTIIAAGFAAVLKAMDKIEEYYNKRNTAIHKVYDVYALTDAASYDTEQRIENLKTLIKEGIITNEGGINMSRVNAIAREAAPITQPQQALVTANEMQTRLLRDVVTVQHVGKGDMATLSYAEVLARANKSLAQESAAPATKSISSKQVEVKPSGNSGNKVSVEVTTKSLENSVNTLVDLTREQNDIQRRNQNQIPHPALP